MPEKQIICAWYSNKMSINRLSAPNSNICLIRLCAWSNFILLLSASCQSSPGPKHFLISSILFSIQSNPYSALMFHALLLKSKTQIQESICKKIHTMTDKCKYSVFTKPSYKWFIFVTKILLASSATTFAHRRTSSSNTYWLIQAKSRLNVHTATFLVQASKLKTHKLTHSGEEPFICIQCHFSCTQADNLKRHMKTHTGEKTHKCVQCDYFFIHCQMLENHMRTHTGDVWSMCSFLCSVSRSESTQAQTHKRETFQLWPMWLYLCSSWHSESTHARNPTNMSSVTIPVLMLLVWSDIGSNTLEKSLSSVTSATILALKLVIWKYTNANTQEKNLSTVTNVTTPVLGPNVWKYTSVTTQERNPSNVTSAVTLANNQVTCSGTRGRCTRQQKTCKNKQFWLYWTGHYFFFVHADRK